MRFKKTPLRTYDESISTVGGKETIIVSTMPRSREMDHKPNPRISMSHFVHMSDTNTVTKPQPFRHRTYGTMKSFTKDEETQAAQAKLRQFEALGHIKVEVDEDQNNEYNFQQPAVSSSQNSSAQQVTHVSQKVGSGTIDVPPLKDMVGKFGFTVSVEEKERTTKSPMWLMSNITKKLYTNINKAVPFEVRLSMAVPRDSLFVRATVVFSSAQFLRTNVSRCPNHASPADPTNHDFPYPEHVLRADHPEAQYDTSSCGRLSVIVPLDTQDGSSYTPILLRFMCLGSCVGGINRRPIAIILTLEDREGSVYGRKVIDVRVCACPTRDIKTDEAALTNKGPKRKSSILGHQDKTPVVIRKKPKLVETKSEPHDDDIVFTIPVRGRKLYEFLVRMKEVYYQTHPEYAAKYPDDLISLHTYDDIEDDLKKRNLQIHVEENETVTWDSGGDSPHRIVINHDPQSGTLVAKNSSPLSKLTPNITISPQSFQLRLFHDTTTEEIPFVQENSVPEYIPCSVAQNNCMIINPAKVIDDSQKLDKNGKLTTTSPLIESMNYIPKHIPVRQLPYKSSSTAVKTTKVMPLLKPSISQNGGCGKSSRSSKKKMKESVSYSALDCVDSVESDYSSVFSEQSSPLSPEMLAANVLVGGFKDEHVSLQ